MMIVMLLKKEFKSLFLWSKVHKSVKPLTEVDLNARKEYVWAGLSRLKWVQNGGNQYPPILLVMIVYA